MVESWRRAWASPRLPFGIVSLAGSTSEARRRRTRLRTQSLRALRPSGPTDRLAQTARSVSQGNSDAMPAFRNAQTAGGGLLPSALLPATFVAQAFDAGDASRRRASLSRVVVLVACDLRRLSQRR